METPGLQFAYTTYLKSDFRRNIDSNGVVDSINTRIANNVIELPLHTDNNTAESTNKIITTRNVIIALIFMLIFLLTLQVTLVQTLQAPVCCDDTITKKLSLPDAVEQPLRPAPVSESFTPSAPAKKPVTGTVVKPINADVEPVKALPVRAIETPEPVLTVAAVALATDPDPAAPGMNENIKSDATTTLAAVVESNFIKISNTGKALAGDEVTWECVEDRSNHLTWEVKKNDGGIQDKSHSYSWFHSISGEKGIRNGGRCKGGINCDTSSYVRAMNERRLCGYTDWRLPTKEELETLVEYNNASKNAKINNMFFPEAVPSWYWTASEHPQNESYAWYVLFQNGIALNDLKERPKHIRLVRGNGAQ